MKLSFAVASLALAFNLGMPVNATTITLSEYTDGQKLSSTSPSTAPGYYWGMSLYLDDAGAGFVGYNDLAVSLFGAIGSVGEGQLYAFTTPMENTFPEDLVNLDPFAVGLANDSGVWEFGGGDYFLSNQYYHFYSDTFISEPVYGFGNSGDVNQGFWYALDEDEWKGVPDAPDPIPSALLSYEYQPNALVNHSVEGNGQNSLSVVTSVPEPAGFMLFGIGLVGIALSRRNKRG
tara:strand:- start:145 stop:843 length:699 start_codon:yes stop_codon:yes gene_type:complete